METKRKITPKDKKHLNRVKRNWLYIAGSHVKRREFPENKEWSQMRKWLWENGYRTWYQSFETQTDAKTTVAALLVKGIKALYLEVPVRPAKRLRQKRRFEVWVHDPTFLIATVK